MMRIVHHIILPKMDLKKRLKVENQFFARSIGLIKIQKKGLHIVLSLVEHIALMIIMLYSKPKIWMTKNIVLFYTSRHIATLKNQMEKNVLQKMISLILLKRVG